MLEHLFGSKTRAHLLRLFFREPERAFYVRELTRILDTQINAIRRELEILAKLSLVKEVPPPPEAFGEEKESGQKKKFFRLNEESIIYSEMKALLIRAQLMDEQELIDELLHKGGRLKLFLITGRFTGDKRAPVDMLFVGEVKEKAIGKIMEEYEKKFGFALRYTTMTHKEFTERREMMDKFLYSIFEADHLKVVDTLTV